jgi:hypothetical protein
MHNLIKNIYKLFLFKKKMRGGQATRGGKHFFGAKKHQEVSTTKPVIINQPSSNAHPIIDKVS